MRKTLEESTSERNWRVAREEREERSPSASVRSIYSAGFDRSRVAAPTANLSAGHPGDSEYAIYMLDPDGKINSWNSGAEHFKGHTPSAYVGQHFSRLYTKQAQQQSRPQQALQMAAQSGRYEDEGWSMRADGSRFWAHVVIDLIKDEAGSPVGFVKVIRDISERHTTELRLQDLHTANREMEQFIHIASHDLREPLRKLQSFNSLLLSEEGDQLSEQARGYLKNMTAATQRMQELLSSLLTLTRVTSQGQAFKPVDLNQVLRDVCNDLAVLINESGADVQIEPLCEMHGDAAQLRQLFQNLISNGIKYVKPGGTPVVQVSQVVSQNPDDVTLVVQDNGIGFDPQFREKIFGVFQRLHGRDKYSGAGVGLSICRKICERHGGQVSAQSQGGEGARFTVTLPMKHDDVS